MDYEDNLKEIYYLANQFKGRVQFINLPSHNEAFLKQFDVDMSTFIKYSLSVCLCLCVCVCVFIQICTCSAIVTVPSSSVVCVALMVIITLTWFVLCVVVHVVGALPALFLMDVQTMTQYAYKGVFEWGALSEYTSNMLNGG